MPTSSQSLILHNTNGQLPPLFGRRLWRPELPPGPEWTPSEYPMSTVQIQHNYQGIGNKGQKLKKKPQSLKRVGSAPELTYKIDFSSLPQLLKVRGLHGTVRYETDTKYLSWKINSIGPFYNRLNAVKRTSAGRNLMPGKLRYFHADRERSFVYDQEEDVSPEYSYHPKYTKQVQFRDPSTSGNEAYSCVGNSKQDDIFISMEGTEGRVRMRATHRETADYFKLILVQNQSNNTNDSDGVVLPVFRLEKCHPSDVGCFMLAPTEPKEVGDYKLVPSQGYIADDFRLVPSSDMQNAFILLQSDAATPGMFRPVMQNKEAPSEFRMIQAKIQEQSANQNHIDVIMPMEAWGETWGEISCNPEHHRRYDNNVAHSVDKNRQKSHTVKASENRFNYFDDVIEQNGHKEKEYTFPEISLHESHAQGKGVLHHVHETVTNTNQTDTFTKDLMTFNQHLEEFNQRYTDTLRQASSREMKQPVRLSFQNENSNMEGRKKTVYNAGSSSTLLGSDWKTHNFDQWSRTTKTSDDQPLSHVNIGLQRNVQKLSPISFDQKDTFEEKDSLFDEVKFKENYKMWKKKKVATLRMRKELPPSDPTAICMRLGDTDLSHDALKAKIEKVTGHNLVSLQFDPVSVHSIDPEATSRWIVRFAEVSVCDSLVENGIRIDGTKSQVSKFDDVMKEEHEAYKLYKMMKDFADRKPPKTAIRKDIQKSKLLKTSQTQTHKHEIQ